MKKKAPAKKAAKRRGPAKMTVQHKAALASGRAASKAVRDYLQALETTKPKRGRKRTKETIERQLAETKAAIPAAGGLRKLELAQRRIDLENELAKLRAPADNTEARDAFIEVAAAYAKAKGISYRAWRQAGVPMADLKAAGILTGN